MENNEDGTHALLARWDAWGERQLWRKVQVKPAKPESAALAEKKLAELEGATALDALAANAKLVAFMTGWRWLAIKSAREDGATWEQIGEALGTTKQGAQVAYRRAIEAQEKYAPDFHDTAAARAVLDTDDQGEASTDPPQAVLDRMTARGLTELTAARAVLDIEKVDQ